MNIKFPLVARSICLLVGAVAAAAQDSPSADWTGFRGPSGSGVLKSLDHPETWSNETNLAWSVDMKGGGLSSPIVVGNQIFLTTAIGFKPPVSFMEGVRDMRPKTPDVALKFVVQCLSLDNGAILWEKTIAEEQPKFPIHSSNSFATESPASDGKQLYIYFASIGTVCALDFDGNLIWRKDVGAYPTGNGFGPGSSIAIGEGNVFVQCDNDLSSFIVALDAATGEESWKKERDGKTSWASPLLWKNSKRNELVTCGSGFVTSYEPENGNVLWKLSGIGMSFSASPAVDNDRIYFGNSGPMSSGPLVAVSAGMTGEHTFAADTTIENVAWSKMQAGPGMSSPVSTGGYVYIPSRSKLTCYSANSGEVAFKQRLKLGSMAASMWAAGDRAFLMDESGKTVVLEVGPEMKIVATNEIADDLFWSTPAVAGKSLLLRGARKLYCIRE